MSNQYIKKPVSVVIFDRTLLYGSDVPVFSHSLKQKVNTPVDRGLSDGLSQKTVEILSRVKQEERISLSRADSLGGQTSEFAQGKEVAPVLPPLHTDKKSGEEQQYTFAETPALERKTWTLQEQLFYRFYRPGEIFRISTPAHQLLRSQHRAGIIDRVVLSAAPMTWNARLEPYRYGWRRIVRHGAESYTEKLIPAVYSTLRSVEVWMSGARNSIAQVIAGSVGTLLGATDEWSGYIRRQRLQLSLIKLASRTMLAGSIVLMLLTVGPMVALEAQGWKQQIAYAIKSLATRAVEESVQPTPNSLAQATATPIPTPNPDPEKQFQILIPKIGVDSKVLPNIDAGDEKEYDAALQKGVAHALGTGLPGEEKAHNRTIFIFGHSTNGAWNISRYNALFYSLKDLTVGDEVTVWFWGREYSYTVQEKKIVNPDDVSFLMPQTAKEQLILQTCWPPGTTAKRLLVIAEPVK